MIIFVEATNDVEKAIIFAFNHYSYNSKAHDGLINKFIDYIFDTYKGEYSKADLMAAFNKIYKRNVSLSDKGSIKTSPASGSSRVSNRQVQDSNPGSYEASPGIVQRLYNPRSPRSLWGGYQLNKFEQDIVNFINTNNHAKMDAIRKKPAFNSLCNKLIKNAPVQKILYRKEDSLRFNKVGDIVSFDVRSFSAKPDILMMTKFTKGAGQEILYRVTGLRGINIGAYDDFTNVSAYEDEYLCTGNCKITAISKKGDTLIVDAKAV